MHHASSQKGNTHPEANLLLFQVRVDQGVAHFGAQVLAFPGSEASHEVSTASAPGDSRSKVQSTQVVM